MTSLHSPQALRLFLEYEGDVASAPEWRALWPSTKGLFRSTARFFNQMVRCGAGAALGQGGRGVKGPGPGVFGVTIAARALRGKER